MHPLLFLASRSIVNGFKRALTSPKRLIGLLGACAYYFWLIVRPIMAMQATSETIPNFGHHIAKMPPLALIDSIIFWFFALLTLIMVGGSSAKTLFKPADVDVLFATPVHPKHVLAFRLGRDYLLSMLLPIVLVAVTYQPARLTLDAFIRGFPKDGMLTFRAMGVAWLMLAMFNVCLQYSICLTLFSDDRKSDRNKKIFDWSSVTVVLGLVTLIYLQAQQVSSVDDFIAMSHLGYYRALFLPATLSTRLAMGPLEESLAPILTGALGLLGLAFIALKFALDRAPQMYDLAASRGYYTSEILTMHRGGNIMGIYAARARVGKLKVRRRWYHNWTVFGPLALVWKEMILQQRSANRFAWFLLALLVGLCLFLVHTSAELPEFGRSASVDAAGLLLLVFEIYGALLLSTAMSQAGFRETIRRLDLLKPLPFSSLQTVVGELAAKCTPIALFAAVNGALCVALRPNLWPYSLIGLITAPLFGLLISAITFFIILMFPEIEDQTQRGFGVLVSLVGLFLVAVPGLVIFVFLAFYTSIFLASLSLVAYDAITIVALIWICGRLYGSLNPSE
jgi:hypothetical protein